MKYWPVRALTPGVVYRLVGVDENGERVRYGVRVVGGWAADRVAPIWRGPPWVTVTATLRDGCLLDVVVMVLRVDVEDESPVRVTVEARPADGSGGMMFAMARPEEGLVRVEWVANREWFMRSDVEYAARVCAQDAAGNRSCAPGLTRFRVPTHEEEGDRLFGIWYARQVWRARTEPWDEPEVVGQPPPAEERMERARVPRAPVDWRCASAGAAGALLVLAVAALVRARRAARRRVSRTA